MDAPAGPRKTALLISYSDIYSDPRVRRQLDWLTQDGWVVDTLGVGSEAPPDVRSTFTLAPPTKWVNSNVGYLVTGALLPRRIAFRQQILNRVPELAKQRVSSGEYDLIVFNEIEFLPWLADSDALGAAQTKSRLHVDLHEKHRRDRRRDTIGAKLASPYYRWQYRQISNPNVSSRTVVNEPIGRLYVDEMGIQPPTPIRNIPPFEDLHPVYRGDGKIKLLFHGLISQQRGLKEIVDAIGELPNHFEATFMLMPNPALHAWLQELIDSSPARDRMAIVPPAPMRDIAKRINSYDLEVIYYPHLGANLLYSLPNKFFESIQGRLGIVTRDSGLMGALICDWGNGVLVPSHSGKELANALRGLTLEDVQSMKLASDRLAHTLNAETEGRAFVRAVTDSTAVAE